MQHTEALSIAGKIYEYYYTHAIKEFESKTATNLAQIPADYVYNSLVSNQDCYINGECCLEYCYDRLDAEFNKMDPEIKRKVYEKAFGVQAGNVSDAEINMRLKSKRRKKTNELYYSRYNALKVNNENTFVESFKNLSMKRNRPENINQVFKKLNLN
jgi:hypothetical protein